MVFSQPVKDAGPTQQVDWNHALTFAVTGDVHPENRERIELAIEEGVPNEAVLDSLRDTIEWIENKSRVPARDELTAWFGERGVDDQ